jgi:hypothetical protein
MVKWTLITLQPIHDCEGGQTTRRATNGEGRPNYLASTEGRLLFNPRVRDPTDKKGGKRFRRRFRVPHRPLSQKEVRLLVSRLIHC